MDVRDRTDCPIPPVATRVLTVSGDPSADDDQIVACEIYISGQLLDSQYRRGKNATVTCSYSSWQQEPFNGREVAIGILDNQKQLAKIKAGPQ